ncbi:methyltransferase domain-containing protein [Stutzerimonas marianensis]|uniref:methyltransferase domain-containing protein n=1 Tax=Stutzerimonas marianensis TaxID=2929513 RepID=UPI003C2E9C35
MSVSESMQVINLYDGLQANPKVKKLHEMDNVIKYIISLGLSGTYVDIGCGDGQRAASIAKFSSACRMVCIDNSPLSLDLAEKNLQQNGLLGAVYRLSSDSTSLSSLDELLKDESDISMIYIDVSVEGIASILRGAVGVLSCYKPLIYFGNVGASQDVDVLGVLSRFGYELTKQHVGDGCEFVCADRGHKRYFDVAAYWEKRYTRGGTSGAGSYNRLAGFKAQFLNDFVKRKGVGSVIEFGCGDGNQLSLISYPRYLGLDISSAAVERCIHRFSDDESKEFRLYDPEVFDRNSYRADLAVSLDVIYHLSNDQVYAAYLRDLFGVAEKFVIIYSNSTESYGSGTNNLAGYVRFRDFLTDVAREFRDWVLVEAEPNKYPFNPSLPNETSIADFFVYKRVEEREQDQERKPFDAITFAIKKTLNQTVVNAEQVEFLFKGLSDSNKNINALVEENRSLRKEMYSLQENHRQLSSELGVFKGTADKLSLQCKELKIEAESSKLKVEASTQKLNEIRNSASYMLGYLTIRAIKKPYLLPWLPVSLGKLISKRIKKKRPLGDVTAQSKGAVTGNTLNLELMVSRLISSRPDISKVVSIVYADINLNVIDGSSVWLVSITKLMAAHGPVALVVKEGVRNSHLFDDLLATPFVHLIMPKDITGTSEPIGPGDAIEFIKSVDLQLPLVSKVLVRGCEVARLLLQTRQFQFRAVVYLTDFYRHTDKGPIIDQENARVVKDVARRADTFLVQTVEIAEQLQNIVGRTLNTIELPPPLPDINYVPPTPIRSGRLKLVYAGKIAPKWGIEELFDWVARLRKAGFFVEVTIFSNKISAYDSDGTPYRSRIIKAIKALDIKHIQGASRSTVIGAYRDADYAWCFRPAELENNVLEISTKLLEAVASGARALTYPSSMNKRILGQDYPYYVENYLGLISVLERREVLTDMAALSIRLMDQFSHTALKGRLSKLFINNIRQRKIIFAGHDFKFVDAYISYLKSNGCAVMVDTWQWGAANDLNRTKKMFDWADTVFCEWGLANAVWFSKNNWSGKHLIVRAHAQEVRDRAKKFGYQIDQDKITKFIFVSERVCDQAKGLFNWPKEKTCLIPNYLLDSEFYPTIARGKLGLSFGMVGIIPQSKRFDRALDLIEGLHARGYSATLYVKGHRPEQLGWMNAPGRRSELDEYHVLYKRIRHSQILAENVVFEGFGADVAEWYQKIDFILSPSDHESFHYALADGVLSGCIPLVWPWEGASKIYPAEWIVNGLDGCYSKIKYCTSMDLIKLSEMLKANRAYLVDRYGFQKIASRLNDLLDVNSI